MTVLLLRIVILNILGLFAAVYSSYHDNSLRGSMLLERGEDKWEVQVYGASYDCNTDQAGLCKHGDILVSSSSHVCNMVTDVRCTGHIVRRPSLHRTRTLLYPRPASKRRVPKLRGRSRYLLSQTVRLQRGKGLLLHILLVRIFQQCLIHLVVHLLNYRPQQSRLRRGPFKRSKVFCAGWGW